MKTEHNSNLTAPTGDPLAALDAARENIAQWQNATNRELSATRGQLQSAQDETASTRRQLSAAQTSAGQLRGELESARGEFSAAQNELASTRGALNIAQNAAAGAQNELARARDELVRRERERADLQEKIAAVAVALETLRAEEEAARGELSDAKNELASTRDELENVGAQLSDAHQTLASTRDVLQKTRDEAAQHAQAAAESAQAAAQHAKNAQRAEDENAEYRKRADDACAQLERSEQRRRELQKELLEVYADLRADDLPSLILRIAMKLTGAENGLFADAEGTCALASIGLDDLPRPIAEALFDFTREAAQMEEPLVKNNSEELPDHDNLVNLAALPVAVQGDLRGVILVANKRDDIFTEEDTELLLSIGRHAGVAMENHRLHAELAQAYVSTIAVLADAIEAKDPYTRGHCESVARLAVEMARRMDLSAESIEQVRYAALLHDVGKIGVPDGILLKPGRLLPEEYAIIQKHSAIGRDLVSRVPSLEKIAPFILHHHERIDGSGYPDHLAGENIPLEARIIGVIDAFDAMTTPRPYRDPVSPREAMQELKRCTGTQFDAELVELAAQIIEEREAGIRAAASTSDVPGAPDGKCPDA